MTNSLGSGSQRSAAPSTSAAESARLSGGPDEAEAMLLARLRALETAEARYERALGRSGITLFCQDRELRYLWLNRPLAGLGGDLLGKTDAEILPEASRGRLIALKQQVIDSGAAADGEVSLQFEDGVRWWDLHVEPDRDETGEVVGITGSVVDVTEYKESEQRLRLLMRELVHRSRNLLTVIMAVARQTASTSDSLEDFIAGFSERVQALSAAHDLLVQESWHGVPIMSLMRAQLGHCADLVGSRISLDGPAVLLTADAAQHLGLALHELATNAVKYGALSGEEGRVDIGWQFAEGEAGDNGSSTRRFHIHWIESGGPPVEPPKRRGFGQVVIERTVARALGGSVALDYAPEGLSWHLDAAAESTIVSDNGRRSGKETA
ncbi:HWE histidine kinase domain-containing protein [Chelatococcus sp. SYSU_G07232]|uniref:Blue-light-activated histidine kinase n=1 Tax=Chelatococcus albus TaxID=3047466 RepID=A0ABT7AGP9_9HYPH|nr:HWE histidine kinase domain-containing protein [Chelatococcus sp. SYSU_G07232]MDJ1158533.1 HWE histidine kinase domain-containing protein [Chelatococcus sp. SYSU_G07232]